MPKILWQKRAVSAGKWIAIKEQRPLSHKIKMKVSTAVASRFRGFIGFKQTP